MYYMITDLMCLADPHESVAVVIKARRPLRRVPMWSSAMKLRPETPTRAIIHVSEISKLSHEAWKYLKEFRGRWLAEEEFVEAMTKAIGLTFKRRETVERRLRRLEAFVAEPLPRREEAAAEGAEPPRRYPIVVEGRPPGLLIERGRYLMDGVRAYRRSYMIWSDRRRIFIPREPSDAEFDPRCLTSSLAGELEESVEAAEHVLEHRTLAREEREELERFVRSAKEVLAAYRLLSA
jgi:hypothetical protein